ncbi:MAG: hypothetical protein INQ03_08785 [Candidatus Heimdallarchaeota archaeon]|nr:hypothetical protein [Candidatus Heimdallarchaeota archaeon]
MSTESVIRLIMFTSDKCIWCPPIERVVREVLMEGGMQELVHISVIDVEAEEDSKGAYDIQTLPKVYINDKLILEGGMDDENARDLMWSAMLNFAFKSKQEEELIKTSLLNIEMNSIESLNDTAVLRPSIGDHTHIGTYQQSLLSLYSLDPLVPYFLYNAGYNIGMYGIMHNILHTLNPKLGTTPQRSKKFIVLGKALELYFSNRELYSTRIASGAKVIEQTESSIFLRVNELASASIGIDVGEPMCGFVAGQLAGVTTALMGTQASCAEQICLANGGDFCLFKISIDKDFERQMIPAAEDKFQRMDRKYNFYEVIHEITSIMEKSTLMRKPQRPNAGDFIHISVYQPIIITLKLLDSLSGVILYSGGRELGVFGPGKDLLDQLRHEKGDNGIVSPEIGVSLLYEYLTHPTSYLRRDYGRVHLHKIDEETYHLEFEENASVAGMARGNLNLSFCDFQAGFLAGRLHILIGLEPIVKEINCQGNGHEVCVFEIKIRNPQGLNTS